MPYEMDDGAYNYSHVGDREFLDAWLRHSDFHLIK
jgi:hypothetical protein